MKSCIFVRGRWPQGYCGSSCPSLSSGQGHCVVFLDKTRISHSAFLYPGVEMGT